MALRNSKHLATLIVYYWIGWSSPGLCPFNLQFTYIICTDTFWHDLKILSSAQLNEKSKQTTDCRPFKFFFLNFLIFTNQSRWPSLNIHCKATVTLTAFSVGSNPNIPNFELLWTWQVELRTHSNPGSLTKTELRTYSNSSKKSELQTCLVRIWPNPGPNPEKTKVQTFLNPGLSTKTELRTLQKSWTLNPRTGSDLTLTALQSILDWNYSS